MSFKERLKEGLKANGYTQREFAKLLGVSPSTLSEYIHGACKPSQERRERIEELLEMKNEPECELSEKFEFSNSNKLTVKEAARLLNESEEHVRQAILQGSVSWGYPVKRGSKWTFHIYRQIFERQTGIEV